MIARGHLVAPRGELRAEPARAIAASDDEHRAAIAETACPICFAEDGMECFYGAGAGLPAGRHYPGKAHMRRVRVYLDGVVTIARAA